MQIALLTAVAISSSQFSVKSKNAEFKQSWKKVISSFNQILKPVLTIKKSQTSKETDAKAFAEKYWCKSWVEKLRRCRLPSLITPTPLASSTCTSFAPCSTLNLHTICTICTACSLYSLKCARSQTCVLCISVMKSPKHRCEVLP